MAAFDKIFAPQKKLLVSTEGSRLKSFFRILALELL
jgi:hypothetical protein